ncbi:MAG: ROK family protein [Lachnospiraceae bacterium]|nr:ROK family protein [Lachnospiraceae bacterium]
MKYEVQGAKNNDILRMNSALILKIIRERKICSRVELAKATGLTQASITKIVASLIHSNILRETGNLECNERGRKSIGLQLNGDSGKVIALKFSRSSISVGVFDISGHLYTKNTFRITEQKTLDVSFQHTIAIIGEYMTAYDNIMAIGVAIPGPYLKKLNKIALSTEFHDWTSFSPKKTLEAKFNLPVFTIHDVNAATLAHWWSSNSSKSTHSLGYILLGEEISGGLIIDDHLFEGSLGTSIEIGHISMDLNGELCRCGNRGCLEQYCSTTAIIKKAKKLLVCHPESGLNQYKELTYYDIFNEFEKGDKLAHDIIKEACEYIGYGVINFIYTCNPDIIILGDQMTRAGSFLLETVNRIVKNRVISELYEHTTIRLESLETDSILYGAAAIATDYILNYSLDVYQ